MRRELAEQRAVADGLDELPRTLIQIESRKKPAAEIVTIFAVDLFAPDAA